ncbi:MAG: L,D-transpeptidase family protein [Solirubrobacterales bacterium]
MLPGRAVTGMVVAGALVAPAAGAAEPSAGVDKAAVGQTATQAAPTVAPRSEPASAATDSGPAPRSSRTAPQRPRVTVKLGGVETRSGRRLARLGDRTRVRVVVRPWQPGTNVELTGARSGRTFMKRVRVATKVPGRDVGVVTASFLPRAEGRFHLSARAAVSNGPISQTTTRRFSLVFPRITTRTSGWRASALQRLLARRHYAVPRSGRYDTGTQRAVLAFRKVNGLGRTAAVNDRVWRTIVGGGAFRPKSTRRDGRRRAEIDISRQVMALVRNGRVYRTYHVSTGSPRTPTIRGRFRVYRHEAGTNSLGMIWSVYFRGGYAIHGYKSVPSYNASHGCVRVPPPNARSIYRWMRRGDHVHTYR